MLDEKSLEAVGQELAPLVGGRIQRVDVVADREIVLELRYPGRTLRLLVSARLAMGRLHLVASRPPRGAPGGDLQRVLRKRLEGRPLVALEVGRRRVTLDARDHQLQIRLDGGKDAVAWLPPSGRPVPPVPEPSALPERFPLSETIARRYEGEAQDEAAVLVRRDLLRRVAARDKKLAKLETNLGRDRAKLESMAESGRLGELLKSSLGRVPRGARAVELLDFMTGEKVEVGLDPALSAKANMERFFGRAKKAERGRPVVAERLEGVLRRRAELRALETRIREADLATLIALRDQDAAPDGEGELAASSARPLKRLPIDKWSRRFEADDGTEIRVGRGAAENDRLTLSAARGDDIWLHASGASGAHVLVRVQKGSQPSREALLDAAQLAAHYSGSRRDTKVEVVYTEARYVRKMKGDPPGRVSVARGKTLLVAPDPVRIERLFGRAGLKSPSHRSE